MDQSALVGMHLAGVVFVAGLVAGVAALAVYHCRRYHLYQRARLLPESPSFTPSGSPTKAASCITLTEVISLRSFVTRPRLPVFLPLRQRGNATSYSPLEGTAPSKDLRHSLPNSPFLTRRDATPTPMRRSCSQLARRLRRGSTRRKRRSASVDELEIRCISPISETQREDEAEAGKECNKEPEKEENGKECCEIRPLMQVKSGTGVDSCNTTPRMAKDRRRVPPLSRATSAATMRASSSVSDMSMNGGEYEFDYYDYDMDNASAVPGSLFGLDPLLLAWAPCLAPTPSPEPADIPLNCLNLNPPSPTATPTPTAEEPPRPPTLHLNILQNVHPVQPASASIKSNEANSTPPDLDLTPTAHEASTPKILNLDDIQFADESDEDEDL